MPPPGPSATRNYGEAPTPTTAPPGAATGACPGPTAAGNRLRAAARRNMYCGVQRFTVRHSRCLCKDGPLVPRRRFAMSGRSARAAVSACSPAGCRRRSCMNFGARMPGLLALAEVLADDRGVSVGGKGEDCHVQRAGSVKGDLTVGGGRACYHAGGVNCGPAVEEYQVLLGGL